MSRLPPLTGRAAAVAAIAATLLIGLLFAVRPFLSRDRTLFVATPTPPAPYLVEPVRLEPGQRACLDSVAFDSDTEVAVFTMIATPGRPAPPLEVTASGRGYRASSPAPGGYAGTRILNVPLEPPKKSVLGDFCIRNAGRPGQTVAVQGSQDPRVVSRPTVRVDGSPIPQEIPLTFAEAKQASLLSRLPDAVERATAFKAWWVGRGLLWPLLVLVVAGLPAGAIYALVSSLPPAAEAEDAEQER